MRMRVGVLERDVAGKVVIMPCEQPNFKALMHSCMVLYVARHMGDSCRPDRQLKTKGNDTQFNISWIVAIGSSLLLVRTWHTAKKSECVAGLDIVDFDLPVELSRSHHVTALNFSSLVCHFFLFPTTSFSSGVPHTQDKAFLLLYFTIYTLCCCRCCSCCSLLLRRVSLKTMHANTIYLAIHHNYKIVLSLESNKSIYFCFYVLPNLASLGVHACDHRYPRVFSSLPSSLPFSLLLYVLTWEQKQHMRYPSRTSSRLLL